MFIVSSESNNLFNTSKRYCWEDVSFAEPAILHHYIQLLLSEASRAISGSLYTVIVH